MRSNRLEGCLSRRHGALCACFQKAPAEGKNKSSSGSQLEYHYIFNNLKGFFVNKIILNIACCSLFFINSYGMEVSPHTEENTHSNQITPENKRIDHAEEKKTNYGREFTKLLRLSNYAEAKQLVREEKVSLQGKYLPVSLAAGQDNEESRDMIQFCIDNGIDINKPTHGKNHKYRPLMVAFFMEHENLLSLLLANGANPHLETNLNEKSILDTAFEYFLFHITAKNKNLDELETNKRMLIEMITKSLHRREHRNDSYRYTKIKEYEEYINKTKVSPSMNKNRNQNTIDELLEALEEALDSHENKTFEEDWSLITKAE